LHKNNVHLYTKLHTLHIIKESWTKLTSKDKILPITTNILLHRYAFPWSIRMCIMLLKFLRFRVPTTATMKVVPWGSHKSDYESGILRLNITVTSPDWSLPHVCTTSFHAGLTILFRRWSSKFFWNAGTKTDYKMSHPRILLSEYSLLWEHQSHTVFNTLCI
jgi:hypothetical protein